MLKNKDQRVGVFIDIQNLYHSAKNLYNSRVNFKELLRAAVGGRKLIRAIAYVVKTEVTEGGGEQPAPGPVSLAPATAPDEGAPADGEDKTYELADMFKMLGDPSRLRIVIATLEGPVSVSEIAEALGLSLSLVSHHLRLLRAARLVTADRRGKQIFYMIHDQHVAHVISDMIAHVNEDAE